MDSMKRSGGAEVDLYGKNGKLLVAVAGSTLGGPLTITHGGKIIISKQFAENPCGSSRNSKRFPASELQRYS